MIRTGPLALIATSMLSLCACGKSSPGATPVKAQAQNHIAIARGRVGVEGGIVRIAAPRDGIVAEVRGAVGDAVKAGDVLVVLDTRPAHIALAAARAELNAATAQANLLRTKLPALRQRAARTAEANQAGAISGQSVDDAQQALAGLSAEIVVAEANSEAAKQKIKQAEYEVDARTLRAPVAGRIITRNARVGELVLPQGTIALIELLPDAPRIVRAELNESFVAKIKLGMPAEVVVEANGGKIYSAHVVRLGDVFGSSELTESGQEPTDTRDVECILELSSGADLRVGQRVQVRFPPSK